MVQESVNYHWKRALRIPLMIELCKSEAIYVSQTVGGIDKNHFSKPVLLSYARGYLNYRDLIAIHQIEDSIIAIESKGLRSSQLAFHSRPMETVKRLPDTYRHLLEYKFNIWVDLLKDEKIVAGAILDILIDGKSFVSVDRRFRRANGWARKTLIQGVHLWDINHI